MSTSRLSTEEIAQALGYKIIKSPVSWCVVNVSWRPLTGFSVLFECEGPPEHVSSFILKRAWVLEANETMQKEPIHVANGVPIEGRPDPHDYESRFSFWSALLKYRQRCRDVATLAFHTQFMKSMKVS